MHYSSTDTLVKWFLNNFPMFADLLHCLRTTCKLPVQVPRKHAVFPCDSTAFLLHNHDIFVSSV